MSDVMINTRQVLPSIFVRSQHIPSLTAEVFLRKIKKMDFSPENAWIEKLMVPLESAPRELSNEWLC
jgi:hypothetical protein